MSIRSGIPTGEQGSKITTEDGSSHGVQMWSTHSLGSLSLLFFGMIALSLGLWNQVGFFDKDRLLRAIDVIDESSAYFVKIDQSRDGLGMVHNVIAQKYSIDFNVARPRLMSHPKMSDGKFPFTQGLLRIEVPPEQESCMAQGVRSNGDETLYFMETTGMPASARILKITFENGWRSPDGYGSSDFQPLIWEQGHHKLITVEAMSETLLPGVFGEGVLQLPNTNLFLWTSWRDNLIFRLSVECVDEQPKLTTQDQHEYPLVGWGLGHNSTDELYATDGSDMLYVWDLQSIMDASSSNPLGNSGKESSLSQSFKRYERRRLRIHDKPLSMLNELHYHSVRRTLVGMIFSSYEHMMVEVDPKTGECQSVYELNELGPPQPKATNRYDRANMVLNGVSILREDTRPEGDVLLVTGKMWDSMFLVSWTASTN